MGRPSVRRDQRPPPDRLRWAELPHRYPALPILGGGAVAAGATAGLALGPSAAYASPVLVGLGAGTVALWLALRRARATADNPRNRSKRAGSAGSEPAPTRGRAGVPHISPPRATVTPSISVGRRAGPATPAARAAPAAGDFLWSSWQADVGTLPVGLIGPVREVAYVPRGSEQPVVFPWAEGEVVFLDPAATDGLSPIPPEVIGGLADSLWEMPEFPLAGLEPALPVVTSAQLVEALSTEILATSVLGATPPGAPALSRTNSTTLEVELATTIGPVPTPLQYEALTPVPPHLRPAPKPPSPEGDRTARGRIEPAPHRSAHCASCASELSDPPSWRRCAGCEGSLCRECTVSALVEHQRAWCPACVPPEPMPDTFGLP